MKTMLNITLNDIMITQESNLMRLKIFLKSSYYPQQRNGAVCVRRSHLQFFLRSSEDLLSKSFLNPMKILHKILKRFFEDFIRRSAEDLLII